jgi:hypothetical protein
LGVEAVDQPCTIGPDIDRTGIIGYLLAGWELPCGGGDENGGGGTGLGEGVDGTGVSGGGIGRGNGVLNQVEDVQVVEDDIGGDIGFKVAKFDSDINRGGGEGGTQTE